jgi:hypothetical protein
MRELLNRLRKSGKGIFYDHNVQTLDRASAMRFLNTLSFVIVIIFLALWITAFILLKDNLFTKTLTGNLLTDLSCLTFFGGLVMSIFVGALVGNLLRRLFWKMRVRSKKN